MPKAASICAGVRPISLPAAAVAPKTPIAAVRCQPRSSVPASAMRHETSRPSATANMDVTPPDTPKAIAYREDGPQNGNARMDGAPRVQGVVEIQRMTHAGVQQRRLWRRQADAP